MVATIKDGWKPPSWTHGPAEAVNVFILDLPEKVMAELKRKTSGPPSATPAGSFQPVDSWGSAKLYVQEGVFVFLLWNNLMDWVNMDPVFAAAPVEGENPGCSGAFSQLQSDFIDFRRRRSSSAGRRDTAETKRYLDEEQEEANPSFHKYTKPSTVESGLSEDANSDLLAFARETFLGGGFSANYEKQKSLCFKPGRSPKVVEAWQKSLETALLAVADRNVLSTKGGDEGEVFSWTPNAGMGGVARGRPWGRDVWPRHSITKFDFLVSLRNDDRTGNKPAFLLDVPHRGPLLKAWENAWVKENLRTKEGAAKAAVGGVAGGALAVAAHVPAAIGAVGGYVLGKLGLAGAAWCAGTGVGLWGPVSGSRFQVSMSVDQC